MWGMKRNWLKNECKNNCISLYCYDTKLMKICHREEYSKNNAKSMMEALDAADPMNDEWNQDFENVSWKTGLEKIIQESTNFVSSKRKRIIYLTDAEKGYSNVTNYAATITERLKNKSNIKTNMYFIKWQS